MRWPRAKRLPIRSTLNWNWASGRFRLQRGPHRQDFGRLFYRRALPSGIERSLSGQSRAHCSTDNWPRRCSNGTGASWMSSTDSASRLFVYAWGLCPASPTGATSPASRAGWGIEFALVAFGFRLSHVCPLHTICCSSTFSMKIARESTRYRHRLLQGSPRAKSLNTSKPSTAHANVAQIGTFGTLAARAAIRDVGRAWVGPSASRHDCRHGARPVGHHIFPEALEKSEELAKAYKTDGEAASYSALAMSIEGLAQGNISARMPRRWSLPINRWSNMSPCNMSPARTKSSPNGPWAMSSRPSLLEDGFPRPAQLDRPGQQGSRSDRTNDRPAG